MTRRRVGGDLNLQSLQDSSSYTSRNQSSGGSLTLSPAGVPIGGSISASHSKVNIKGNTDLKGAVILCVRLLTSSPSVPAMDI